MSAVQAVEVVSYPFLYDSMPSLHRPKDRQTDRHPQSFQASLSPSSSALGKNVL